MPESRRSQKRKQEELQKKQQQSVEIGLGKLSAEEDPNLLDEFVLGIPALEEAKKIKSSQYLLVGRTGSGKSAILQRLKYIAQRDRIPYAFVCQKEDDLERIVSDAIKEAESGDSSITSEEENIIYKLAWHYAIIISLIRNRYPDPDLRHFQLFTDRDQIVYNFMRQASPEKAYKMTFSDLFSSILNSAKVEVSTDSSGNKFKASLDGQNLKRQRSTYTANERLRSAERFLHDQLPKVLGSDKAYILIDDLDLGWNPANPRHQKFLSALFSALKYYKNNSMFKPVVALRTDILKSLKHGLQREKIKDVKISVLWTPDLLKEMLKNRVLSRFGTQNVEEIFSGQMQGLPLVDYMISQTLNRPRDLLALCNFACEFAIKSNSPRKVTADHVLLALGDFSLERVEALVDEWKQYPCIDFVLDEIAKHTTQDQIKKGFSITDFQRVCVKIKSSIELQSEAKKEKLQWYQEEFPNVEDPRGIFALMYETGIICISKQQGNAEILFQESVQAMPMLSGDMSIKIHPMYIPFILQGAATDDSGETLFLSSKELGL